MDARQSKRRGAFENREPPWSPGSRPHAVSRPRDTSLSPLAAAATAAEYRHEEINSLRGLHSSNATAATAMADAGAGSSATFVWAVFLLEGDSGDDDDRASCHSWIKSREGRVCTGIKESADNRDDQTSS